MKNKIEYEIQIRKKLTNHDIGELKNMWKICQEICKNYRATNNWDKADNWNKRVDLIESVLIDKINFIFE